MRLDLGAGLILVFVASVASADEAALERKIAQLEQRIRDLEANRVPPVDAPSRGDWTRYVRIGGSADAGYFAGQRNSGFDPDSFQIWDARLFVDAELGQNVRLGERTIFRNVGFSFEWDMVRIGMLRNQVGELYADFQGFLGSDWLSFQVGRFQIPVGEAYHLYSRGYASRPFVTNPVGGPWWWDEGIRVYGSAPDDRYGYVWSLSDGDTAFNGDSTDDKQLTLKIFGRPLPWLYLSASALRGGALGSPTSPASGALWLGESWARPVPGAPNEIENTLLLAGDAILDFEDRARIWLAYGNYGIESAAAQAHNRELHYWIAEVVLRGAWLSEALRPLYLGLRANALGTYDDAEGYLLDFRRGGSLGFDMKSLTAYSAVLGWEIAENMRLRAEYTHQDIALVDGVSPSIRGAARRADYFAFDVGAAF